MTRNLDKNVKVPIHPRAAAIATADDEYTRSNDSSDATYTYISETFDDDADVTDTVWRCYRITKADGSKRWATDPDNGKSTRAFIFAASDAPTLTYKDI